MCKRARLAGRTNFVFARRPMKILALLFALAVPLAAQTAKPVEKKPATAPATPTPKEPYKNLTAEEADKLIRERKEVIVLDVRTAEEFALGHIAGAKNLSLIDPEFDAGIKAYEGKPVLVHCASGARSRQALVKMMKLNFPELHHLEGGINAWLKAGKEVVKSPKGL
jgi:rhodanese-related sulfurtransferase